MRWDRANLASQLASINGQQVTGKDSLGREGGERKQESEREGESFKLKLKVAHANADMTQPTGVMVIAKLCKLCPKLISISQTSNKLLTLAAHSFTGPPNGLSHTWTQTYTQNFYPSLCHYPSIYSSTYLSIYLHCSSAHTNTLGLFGLPNLPLLPLYSCHPS